MDNVDFKIPLPIRFNLWKHHAGYVRSRIKNAETQGELNLIVQELLSIGNSQMDLYIGDFSPAEISSFVLFHLGKNGINTFNDYLIWLHNQGSDYKMITLIDNSKWALRLGNDEQRYVHIHPGRYSVNSQRVKAAALKTAVVSLSWKNLNNLQELDLSVINYVRKEFIGEPPIKILKQTENKGLIKVISLLDK